MDEKDNLDMKNHWKELTNNSSNKGASLTTYTIEINYRQHTTHSELLQQCLILIPEAGILIENSSYLSLISINYKFVSHLWLINAH